MSTSYDVVNNRFLDKITDDTLLEVLDDAEDIVDGYRFSANVRFKQCKKLLDKDDILRVYNQTLTDEEIEILACLMIIEWLTPLVNNIDFLKISLLTKDYKQYTSSSGHLEKIQSMRKDTIIEVNRLIVSYSYSTNKLKDLK